MKWIKLFIPRLRQPSTWRGIVACLTAFGVTIAPEYIPHIIAVGTAVAGAIGLLVDDKIADGVGTQSAVGGVPPVELQARSQGGRGENIFRGPGGP